jgi:hypothetical protein
MNVADGGRARRGSDEDLARQIAHSDAVAELIAAARAPGSARELSGAAAALACFRQARSAGSPAPVRLTPRRSAALLLASAAAGTVLAGASTAAAMGVLPAPLQGAAHQLFDAPPAQSSAPSPAPTRTRSTSPASTAPPSSSAVNGSAGASTSGTAQPSGTPSTSIPPTGTGQPSAQPSGNPARSSATAGPSAPTVTSTAVGSPTSSVTGPGTSTTGTGTKARGHSKVHPHREQKPHLPGWLRQGGRPVNGWLSH